MKNSANNARFENVGSAHIGDKINHYNYSERNSKSHFEKVNLSPEYFRNYLRPTFTDQVIDRLKNHRVILVGGNYSFVKGPFLKLIAKNTVADEQEIKESVSKHSFSGLYAAIEEEAKSSLSILNNLSPREIGFNFKEIRRLAQRRNHTIIISTNEPYDSWHFEEDLRQSHWFEVPDKGLYSKEVLTTYLNEQLEKYFIHLPADKNKVLQQLDSTEQIDKFIEQLYRNKHILTEAIVNDAIRTAIDTDSDNLQQWFDNLNSVDKLIAIALTLLDGAYENQFFAAFDKILNEAWRDRNPDLKSIDYEDLIPFTTFFVIDGITIRSRHQQQRKKIIRLAWRTHKRYILSALPVLRDIVLSSNDKDSTEWELFASENYCINIRNVISHTLSDIGFHSFEDVENIMLQLAANYNIEAQTVTAQALATWIQRDEDKVYGILERWQESIEVRRAMRAYIDKDKGYDALSYIQGTVLLTLYFMSLYEANGKLSERNKQLLSSFITSKDVFVVERMQLVLDVMTTRHPDSMAALLKDKFLLYHTYVEAAASGLSYAYENGYAENVKVIIKDWLKYCEDTKPKDVEDPKSFTHRDKILSAVIVFLGWISYGQEWPISIQYAYEILEKCRKEVHKQQVRDYLISTIVNIIEANFHTDAQINIDMISNIDGSERTFMVNEFVNKYYEQREALSGGNYKTTIDEHTFSSWYGEEKRSLTHIELLMKQWSKSEIKVLSQIAFASIAEFNKIEQEEKRLIEELNKTEQGKLEADEKRLKELRAQGAPKYNDRTQATDETKVFIKMGERFVSGKQVMPFHNAAAVMLQDRDSEAAARRLAIEVTEEVDSKGDRHKGIVYLYKLFRDIQIENNEQPPLAGNFQSMMFFTLACFATKGHERQMLQYFSPFLMQTKLNNTDVNIILRKIKPYSNGWIKFCYQICKYPLLLVAILIGIYLLFKKIF
jgi:hypothetical protein